MIQFLELLDTVFWGYLGFSFIMLLGLYFTIRTRAFQIRALPGIIKTFFYFLFQREKGDGGIHPLKAFFASVGGMLGIGSVVGVVTAIQIGGPGALFWLWMAAFLGCLIKYAEVYLGLKYRVRRKDGGFDGGPMYFLAKAFKGRLVPLIVATLLCAYGIEIYQFSVLTSSVESNWHVDHIVAVGGLLTLILLAIIGGVQRVGKVCATVMPFFMILYMIMCGWIICTHLTLFPSIMASVFKSAFTGHAAIGGFVGSTALLAIQNGMARMAYSADIGVGYDSIIHSESRTTVPERQARLAVFGVFLDSLMCSLSLLIVMMTGVWMADEPIAASLMVQVALSHTFPYMDIFMPTFLLILGYTTLIAYACIGLKCAQFLMPRFGKRIYLAYGTLAMIFASSIGQFASQLLMALVGALLLMTNLLGLYRLRGEVVFAEEKDQVLKTA